MLFTQLILHQYDKSIASLKEAANAIDSMKAYIKDFESKDLESDVNTGLEAPMKDLYDSLRQLENYKSRLIKVLDYYGNEHGKKEIKEENN